MLDSKQHHIILCIRAFTSLLFSFSGCFSLIVTHFTFLVQSLEVSNLWEFHSRTRNPHSPNPIHETCRKYVRIALLLMFGTHISDIFYCLCFSLFFCCCPELTFFMLMHCFVLSGFVCKNHILLYMLALLNKTVLSKKNTHTHTSR